VKTRVKNRFHASRSVVQSWAKPVMTRHQGFQELLLLSACRSHPTQRPLLGCQGLKVPLTSSLTLNP